MKLVNTILIIVLLLFALLFIYYLPVVDRLVNWCDKYPAESLKDCRE